MWTSLMVITGIGAALGNLFFVGATPFVFSLVEGLAAGAMLTMIAQTMLPEAYFKGIHHWVFYPTWLLGCDILQDTRIARI